MQSVALFGVGEKFGATIIEQHHMKLFRPVVFAFLFRAANKRVVAVRSCPAPACCLRAQKQREVAHLGQHFLDA
jgi:hypothetical protein